MLFRELFILNVSSAMLTVVIYPALHLCNSLHVKNRIQISTASHRHQKAGNTATYFNVSEQKRLLFPRAVSVKYLYICYIYIFIYNVITAYYSLKLKLF